MRITKKEIIAQTRDFNMQNVNYYAAIDNKVFISIFERIDGILFPKRIEMSINNKITILDSCKNKKEFVDIVYKFLKTYKESKENKRQIARELNEYRKNTEVDETEE